MTINVPALVARATAPAFDISGLVEAANTLSFRSLAERLKFQRALALEKNGTVFDAEEMFALAEAWNGHFPAVAIAHYKSPVVKYKTSDPNKRFRRGYLGPVGYFHNSMTSRLYGSARSILIGEHRGHSYSEYLGEASVPLVPKSLLPQNPLARRNLHILFDVQDWRNKQEIVDPYLLQRIDDRKFRVLDHWELTDKERQLMAFLNR